MRLNIASIGSMILFLSVAVFSQVDMQATVYDDGKACPGECDAHVVFRSDHNGTLNAYDPAGGREDPEKCEVGEICRVCFSGDEGDCTDVIYRGGGPPVGKFDFTIRYFEENCEEPELPGKLVEICRTLRRNVEKLRARINCFADLEHPLCESLMSESYERKTKDEAYYDECKSLGLEAFNRKYEDQQHMQRDLDCAYSANRRTLPNGTRYRPLLDGACRGKDLVGRNGFDCCSVNLFKSAMDFTECSIYFPDPPVSKLWDRKSCGVHRFGWLSARFAFQ